ncbi:hypothetical protein [Streptomyces sp. NPDC088752]|uniref:hypothetical protein n=1 Tax=Streptomyces sp. NPDC088752 TaxID=3154963 RepID=UPI00342FE6FE
MQQFGLELLMLLEGWAEQEARSDGEIERVKLALVAAGRDPLVIFPEPAPEDYENFDPASDEGKDFDYSAVDWVEGASPDDWAQIQQALESTRVAVQGDEEDEEPDGPDLPDVDFDREWQ